MYRLGSRDAEADDLNLFYYQHYYYYRKGYDQTRRRVQRGQPPGGHAGSFQQRILSVLVVMAIVGTLVAIGVVIGRGGEQHDAAGPRDNPAPGVLSATPTITATATTVPTATRTLPTPTPDPSTLHTGGLAVVTNLGEAPLRTRDTPGITGTVHIYLREGDVVEIVGGPVAADGYVWWQVQGDEGTGWCAESSDNGTVWLQPHQPEQPE